MKKLYIVGFISLFLLAGCQTTQVKELSEKDASTTYRGCLTQQFNLAADKDDSNPEKNVDLAIQGCSDDAMNYAMVFARDYHMRADKHYEHASSTYKPIIEKTSKQVLLNMLNR